MSSSVIRNLVTDKLKTDWTTTRVVDLENGRDPLGSSMHPWASVQFLMATEEQMCLGDIGDRGWREEGEFHLLVAVPTYSGWGTCLTLMDDLRKRFRQWRSNDITIRKVHPARPILDDDQLIGNWFIMAALTKYYRDFYEID